MEEKFGGEAENVTTFWPPYEASREYGEDPSMFTTEGEENTIIEEEHSINMSGNQNNVKKYKMIPNFNPSNKKRVSTSSDEIKPDDINLEEKGDD